MARTYQFDVDTKRYLNRVNVYRFSNKLPDIAKSDAVDIDNFIITLKDLGLWNTCAVWPLRYTHNTGLSSAISFGGGFGNCDMNVSGLTWSTSGVSKSAGATTGYALLPTPSQTTSRTLIAVGGNVNGQTVIGSYGSQSAIRFSARINNSNSAAFDANNISDNIYPTAITAGTYHQIAGTFNQNANTIFVKVDNLVGTTVSNVSPIFPNTLGVTVGGWGPTQAIAGSGTFSFILISSNSFTTQLIDSIYNLNKSTLSKGLGLP